MVALLLEDPHRGDFSLVAVIEPTSGKIHVLCRPRSMPCLYGFERGRRSI